MDKINLIHHKNFLNNNLDNKKVKLIIADPPYFEVKGDFDYVWSNIDEYLKDVEKWAIECKRLLADNGTLIWWGHAKKIAYSQIILDKYFKLENHAKWIKKECQTKRGIKNYRCFAPITEHFLVYSNEINKTGLEEIHSNVDCFKTIKKYMRHERSKLMQHEGFKTISQFNKYINKLTNTSSVVSRHYFADSQYNFPTKEIYEIMQTTGFWSREYEDLRREYEDLRRPFNNTKLLTDAMEFSQESHITKKYKHDTKKPETLTKVLIETCSNVRDLVLAPFSGSGTECAMAKKCGRLYVGYDINIEYVKMGNERCDLINFEE